MYDVAYGWTSDQIIGPKIPFLVARWRNARNVGD